MEAAYRKGRGGERRYRFTFLQKPLAAVGFIALADILFYLQRVGTTLGIFSLSLLAFIVVMRPDLPRTRAGRAATASAGAFALVLCYDPSLLGFALYWLMLTLAVLLPRTCAFDDGWRWTKRLAWHWLRAPIGPLADRLKIARARPRLARGPARNLHVLVLPLVGSLFFLLLFASANPLIEEALRRLDLGSAVWSLHPVRLLFWLGTLLLVWSVLRPRRLLLLDAPGGEVFAGNLPGAGLASVTLSLIAFNAVFLLQDAVDIFFLWSGAALPEGMTLAEYAHRGAYPLIATALLAALFVLVTLRPGSEMAANPLIRRLVYVWIAQNLLLVASTILRTLDYVDAYSLTRLRIAALVWMALVAIGLFLICFRIWRSRSGAWLINANLAASLIALSLCSVADLGRMAASWNTRHAREAGGRGANLDICYLESLGASALQPMIELESRTHNPILKQRVGWARIGAMNELVERQRHWRGWTVVGALRLRSAQRAVNRMRLPSAYGGWRACGGPVPHQPLTPGKGR